MDERVTGGRQETFEVRTESRPTLFPPNSLLTKPNHLHMRDEEEIREQYEFLKEHLDDENMRHEGVRQMFTYYKRALGWVLEEEHI